MENLLSSDLATVQHRIDFEHLNKLFQNNPTPDYSWRIKKLELLEKSIFKFQKKIHEALQSDLGKSEFETDSSEIFPVLTEIRMAKSYLKDWMRSDEVPTPLSLIGTSSKIIYQPKGVVLILSPWNYPFNLAIGVLAIAIAAGNKVILKPSEYTIKCSLVIQEIVDECFTADEVIIKHGGGDLAAELCSLPFHHIFFTGSGDKGKKVLKAAAENLTPVSLELGGKSPAIILESADLKLAAEQLILGKTLNAGQTCIAPDFVLIHESKKDQFISYYLSELRSSWFSEGTLSKDFCSIINKGHFLRLKKYLDEAKQRGARILGNELLDEANLCFGPVVVDKVDSSFAMMQEEIFGPILPVLSYKSEDDYLKILSSMDRPLCLYVFGKNKKKIESVISNTRSGGVSVNSVFLNYCNYHLPFGGDFQSGMGSYHGKFGFETFSHKRSITMQSHRLPSTSKIFMAPYNAIKTRIKNFVLRYL